MQKRQEVAFLLCILPNSGVVDALLKTLGIAVEIDVEKEMWKSCITGKPASRIILKDLCSDTIVCSAKVETVYPSFPPFSFNMKIVCNLPFPYFLHLLFLLGHVCIILVFFHYNYVMFIR